MCISTQSVLPTMTPAWSKLATQHINTHNNTNEHHGWMDRQAGIAGCGILLHFLFIIWMCDKNMHSFHNAQGVLFLLMIDDPHKLYSGPLS